MRHFLCSLLNDPAEQFFSDPGQFLQGIRQLSLEPVPEEVGKPTGAEADPQLILLRITGVKRVPILQQILHHDLNKPFLHQRRGAGIHDLLGEKQILLQDLPDLGHQGVDRFPQTSGLLRQRFPDGKKGLLKQPVHHVGNVRVVGIKGPPVDLGTVYHIGNGDLFQWFFLQQIYQCGKDEFPGPDRAAILCFCHTPSKVKQNQQECPKLTISKKFVVCTFSVIHYNKINFKNQYLSDFGRLYHFEKEDVMNEKRSGSSIEKLAAFIVDKRNLFFLLYVFAFAFCIFSMGWVQVENDVTTYLPDDTQTRQGLVAMNENFTTFATGQVMVSNITYDTAQQICDTFREIEGVDMVTFDDTADHYTNASALYDISFAGGNFDEVSLNALEQIKQAVAQYDVSIYTQVGYDENAMLQQEMTTILLVAVVIIIAVLALTSRAYMEVPVLLLTFGTAALLNMGTNFLLGKISFISDSVAVVLQLALAIDYAIILCHRFSDEHETKNARDAAVTALSKAIPEISASSLTTVSGLAALGFMEFGIGLDLAMVLIKAILLSLLSVFTLMPGLLVLFCPLIDKTRHKKLLPNITLVGKFAVKARRVLPPLFLIVLVVTYQLSSQCPFAYSYNNMKTTKMSEMQTAHFKITDTFGASNMVAVVLPSGNYEAESMILEELNLCSEVKSTMGLSGIEAMDGYTLTDALDPRELSELVGLDYEVVQLLYSAYAAEHDQYGEILSGLEEYEVPLFDMFLYLKDQLQAHNINLSGEDQEMVDELFDQLELAQAQLQNDTYSRMVVYLNLPEEGDETYAFLDRMRAIIGQYYDGDYYVVGNSTSCRDLASSFVSDNLMISILSAFFVIVVLLFTFQSAGLPVLLIVVIQGSIWINFSFPTLTDTPLYFLGYLIVQAIQMGANIDYAIVISSHYQELKAEMPHKEAIVHALNASFPTVFTSGSIMAAAGLLIGNLSAQPVISILGTCLGRGTIISIILVLFVLPSILVLGDSIINRTSFKLKGIEPKARTASGTVRVQGHVRGYISGIVDADIDGIIHGQLNASVATDGKIEEGGSEQ